MSKWLIILLIVIATTSILAVAVSTIANFFFNQNAKKEVTSLLNDIPQQNTETIKKEDLEGLPEPVHNWLVKAGVIGKERTTTVRLKQTGLMRTTEDGPWMPVQAEQYFRVDEPAFVWKAKVKMAPLLQLSGIDNYQNGIGKMSIKVASIYPVVDASGPEMDLSTMVRYLAEIQWFPTAALQPYIKWEAIDATSAKATMSYQGLTASGVFSFNENDDLVRFTTKRYREVNGKFILSDWGGVNKEYSVFDGIRIPSKSNIIWIEEQGEFNWFQCEITEVDYNKPELY